MMQTSTTMLMTHHRGFQRGLARGWMLRNIRCAAAIAAISAWTWSGFAAPTILFGPADVQARIGTEAILSVTATSNHEMAYQWFEDGLALEGATSSNLVLRGVQPMGEVYQRSYHVEVTDIEGTTASESALLTIVVPPVSETLEITTQPESWMVWPGTNVTLLVVASSPSELSYQWYEDGAELSGETNASLTLTNLQIQNVRYFRVYQVMVSDMTGSLMSDEALVTLLEGPRVIQQPRSQYLVVGDTLELEVGVLGTPPLNLRWRKGGGTLLLTTETRLVITNAQPANSGIYSVVITNRAFSTPGILSKTATVNVCEDADNNDLPDCWQQVYLLDPSQSGRDDDPDMDGASNYEEYVSGTNPMSPESFMAFRSIEVPELGLVSLSFLAVSNTSYTVQVRPSATFPGWLSLTDFFAHETNRTVAFSHVNPGVQSSFYRLVTPRVPGVFRLPPRYVILGQ